MNRAERRRGKHGRVPTANAPEPTDDTRTHLIAFPANGRVYLYFPCATKCHARGVTMQQANTSDLESLHFTPDQTREMALSLYALATRAEEGESVDLAEAVAEMMKGQN